MKPTPRKAARTPRPAARFLADVVAGNVRVLRALRGFNQTDLAAHMGYLSHPWNRATVSDVERGRRNVTMDELLALAVSFRVSPLEIFDLRGIDGRRTESLDWGPHHVPIPAEAASLWMRGKVAFGVEGEKSAAGKWYFPAGSFDVCPVGDDHETANRVARQMHEAVVAARAEKPASEIDAEPRTQPKSMPESRKSKGRKDKKP